MKNLFLKVLQLYLADEYIVDVFITSIKMVIIMNSESNTDSTNIIDDVTDTIYGQVHLPDEHDDQIRTSLVSHGEWAYIEVLILGSMMKPGDSVFDLGAYLGTFSMGISSYKPGKIVAVEPCKKSFELLERNLDANVEVKHEIVNSAMGFTNGEAVLEETSDSNLGANTYRPVEKTPKVQNTIEQTTARELVDMMSLKTLRSSHGDYDVIKVDLEGSECEVLRSDAKWIKDNKPVVWAECNENIATKELLQFFLWAELSPYYVAYPTYRRNSYRKSERSPYTITYETALLGASEQSMKRFHCSDIEDEILCEKVESYEHLRRLMWQTPRWGHQAWAELSRPELIALLGHYEKNEKFSQFLPQNIEKTINNYIVVYQYGKVASTSVVASFNAIDGVKSVQSHFLGKSIFENMVDLLIDPNQSDYFHKHRLGQFVENVEINREINKYKYGIRRDSRLSIVTTVREPLDWFRSSVAQDVLGYIPRFEELARFWGIVFNNADQLISLMIPRILRMIADGLRSLGGIDSFLNGKRDFSLIIPGTGNNQCDHFLRSFVSMAIRPFGWFDDHFKKMTGIGLEEFDSKEDCLKVKMLDWCDIYLFRYEDIDHAVPLIAEMLGVSDSFELKRENISTDKPHALVINEAFNSPEAHELKSIYLKSAYNHCFGYTEH